MSALPEDPRYFWSPSGDPVYLTGSHVWWNLVGKRSWRVDCERGSVSPFRFPEYLDRLEGYGHNFIRLWRIELTTWRECGELVQVGPHPWRRTGPGLALDGKPRFDLLRFDESYFRRLRSRVVAAGERGFWVSVMLFEGWAVQFMPPPWNWRGHPFNRRNNVHGIDGDLDGDGDGTEIHTLANPAILEIQERYVRKVLETVGDLDNVLYEIVNEAGVRATRWQYHMIRLVKRYERARGRRHPVGMSFQHGDRTGTTLARSPADWIAPGGDPRHLGNPPPASGAKVAVSDTDHHCGLCEGALDALFPWRAFLRGYHPIFMDPLLDDPLHEAVRAAMGATRRLAERVDLAAMVPRGELVSSGFCLAAHGREYVALEPGSGPLTLDLSAAEGRYTVEWIAPETGVAQAGETVTGGGPVRLFPPTGGPAVVHLERIE